MVTHGNIPPRWRNAAESPHGGGNAPWGVLPLAGVAAGGLADGRPLPRRGIGPPVRAHPRATATRTPQPGLPGMDIAE